MKRQQITLALVACFFLFSVSAVLGQEKNNKVKALPVNTQFEIDFSQLADRSIAHSYLLDISTLEFKSATTLTKFCEMFSFDYQTLKGDFNQSQISIELDLKKLQERGITLEIVEDHLQDISARMLYTYNQLNI